MPPITRNVLALFFVVQVFSSADAGQAGGPLLGDMNAGTAETGSPENSRLPPFACGESATLISSIQGNGASTPMAGITVDVEAIVTAVFQEEGELGGIFLQEEDSDADRDPTTSEGLFAYTRMPATVGDRVRARGAAIEFEGLTELSPVTDLVVCSGGNPAPTPAMPILPRPTADAFEAIENMSVILQPGLVVTDVAGLWRFGEFKVSSSPQFTPTEVARPGEAALAAAVTNALDMLIIDDGRTAQNLDVAHTGADDTRPFDATNPIRITQTISGLAGVMHYSFGAFRLQPGVQPVISEAASPRTVSPVDVGGSLKVASMNVMNYFPTVDSGAPTCGPTGNSDCRGADSASELKRQREKLVSALAAIDADVVGLIELENNAGASLSTLVELLNARVGAGTYSFVDTGTIGSDDIKQGLIYQPASVTPEGIFALLTQATDARFNDEFNRPTLAQSFRAIDGPGLFTVAVNHLKSKGSDCDEIGDPDIQDGQGNCNLTRLSAAQALADWVSTDPTGTGATTVVVIGDMNAYAMEDPIAALEAGGLTNLVTRFQGPLSYTFAFDGQLGSLDYAFGTADTVARTSGAAPWNINSPEAIVLDYNEEFGKPAHYYRPDPYRSSDHDPIIVGLNFALAGTATTPGTQPIVDAEGKLSWWLALLALLLLAGLGLIVFRGRR